MSEALVKSPFGGLPDPLILNRLAGMVNEALTANLTVGSSRQALLRRGGPDPRRDIADECGYQKAPSQQDYYDLFQNEPLAKRVCQLFAKESWQTTPLVYESNSTKKVTQFEKDWDELGTQLKTSKSWHKQEEGSSVYALLKRADELCGIGQYGVILLGFDDVGPDGRPVPLDMPAFTPEYADTSFPTAGGDPVQKYQPGMVGTDPDYWVGRVPGSIQPSNGSGTPATPASGSNGTLKQGKKSSQKRKLLYARPLPERLAQITKLETNYASPRFGQPVEYLITLNDPSVDTGGGVGTSSTTVRVHWTRVVHIADNTESSDVWGVPRMRPVFWPLQDAQKVRGAGCEGYWKSCFVGLSFETHPNLGGDVIVDEAGLRSQYENYINGLQRVLLTKGMSVNQLAPSVISPRDFLEVLIEVICILLGCPVRIFKGSERGELASSQDDASWNDRIKARQRDFVIPYIVAPFVDRLIEAGVLTEPSEGYTIEWADITSSSDSEKAQVALVRTQTLAAYVSGGLQAIIPERDFLVRFMNFKEEEADEIIKEIAELQEEQAAQHALMADEHGLEPTPPPGYQKPDNPKESSDPVTIKPGEKLVDPKTGKKVAEGAKLPEKKPTQNVFCPTGEGGGVDPTCSPGQHASHHTGDVEDLDLGPMTSIGPVSIKVERRGALGRRGDVEAGIFFSPEGGSLPEYGADVRTASIRAYTKVYEGESTFTFAEQHGLTHKPLDEHMAAKYKVKTLGEATEKFTEGTMDADTWYNLYQTVARHVLEKHGYQGAHWTAEEDLAPEQYQIWDKNAIRVSAADMGRRSTRNQLDIDLDSIPTVANVFCPTGPGGGVDPSCSPRQAGKSLRIPHTAIRAESHTPPPPGASYRPDVEVDHNKDGVTDAARIGVPAMSVPPPPKIGRLPNLTPRERAVEKAFIEAYENNPHDMASKFRQIIAAGTKPGEPPTFGTDDAKVLSADWNSSDLKIRSSNRATLNCALHQTANAIAKRAFLQHLDTLKAGDEVMVTVGGCGAGKGFALKNVPQALEMKQKAKAVWDSAGDQNATENPWIQQEAEKRGLKVNYVFVHADPRNQWAHPERGVVKRAEDPADGRMVDAKVFADSYALGARNHQAFYESNKNNPNASFVFLENAGKPRLLPGIPAEALAIDRKELAKFAAETVRDGEAPPHVKRGALVGERIWAHEDY